MRVDDLVEVPLPGELAFRRMVQDGDDDLLASPDRPAYGNDLIVEHLEAEVGQGDAVLLSCPVHEQERVMHARRRSDIRYNVFRAIVGLDGPVAHVGLRCGICVRASNPAGEHIHLPAPVTAGERCATRVHVKPVQHGDDRADIDWYTT